jgi:hypothetical protein
VFNREKWRNHLPCEFGDFHKSVAKRSAMVSVPEAIRRKYGDDVDDPEKTFGQLRGVGATAKINSETGTSPITIFVPLRFTSVPRPSSVLILNNCDIAVAGDEDELKQVCKGMEEMDLSDNKLTSWQEVGKNKS